MSSDKYEVDWAKAPRNAIARTVDFDGHTLFHTVDPYIRNSRWQSDGIKYIDTFSYSDWDKSVRYRPIEYKLEIMARINEITEELNLLRSTLENLK